eukprot:Skav217627  [mRNA]  locus=scaffold2613:28256:39290:+ [translate_table: standard]
MILFKSDPKVDVKEVKTQSMLGRCKMLRAASHFLTEKAFKCRKAYFVKKDVGVLVKSVPKAKDPMEALSGGSDPMAAMGMMKGQMVFMVSQGLLAYWVSHLFSGFLVAKTPFPLTFQFKARMGGMGAAPMMPGGGPDPAKVYKAEQERRPRVVLEHKAHSKVWKRREVGIRVPNNSIVWQLVEDLNEPLLASSAPARAEVRSLS